MVGTRGLGQLTMRTVSRSSIQAQEVFWDLLESLIVDVATEAHRVVHLGLDRRFDHDDEEEAQLSIHARATVSDVDVSGFDNCGKHAIDMFGSSHPAIANDTLDCMNCGRSIVAGRFAPHLEKCMGKVKGRKSRLKSTSTARYMVQRRPGASSLPPTEFSNMGSTLNDAVKQTRVLSPGLAAENSQRSSVDTDNAHSVKSPHDDRISSLDRSPSVKARTKNMKSRVNGVLSQRASISMVGKPCGCEDQVSSKHGSMKSKRPAEKKNLEQALGVSAQVTVPVDEMHDGVAQRGVDPG